MPGGFEMLQKAPIFAHSVDWREYYLQNISFPGEITGKLSVNYRRLARIPVVKQYLNSYTCA